MQAIIDVVPSDVKYVSFRTLTVGRTPVQARAGNRGLASSIPADGLRCCICLIWGRNRPELLLPIQSTRDPVAKRGSEPGIVLLVTPEL